MQDSVRPSVRKNSTLDDRRHRLNRDNVAKFTELITSHRLTGLLRTWNPVKNTQRLYRFFCQSGPNLKKGGLPIRFSVQGSFDMIFNGLAGDCCIRSVVICAAEGGYVNREIHLIGKLDRNLFRYCGSLRTRGHVFQTSVEYIPVYTGIGQQESIPTLQSRGSRPTNGAITPVRPLPHRSRLLAS